MAEKSRVRFTEHDEDYDDDHDVAGPSGGGGGGGWQARGGRRKLSEKELRKMPLQWRSKYMAYEKPPKEISEMQNKARKRISDRVKKDKTSFQSDEEATEMERRKHERLIGQLKAAEARNRIRLVRLQYEANVNEDVNHLIACQPSAAEAVRLEALLPPVKKDIHRMRRDPIDKLSRERIERLMDDELEIITMRT